MTAPQMNTGRLKKRKNEVTQHPPHTSKSTLNKRKTCNRKKAAQEPSKRTPKKTKFSNPAPGTKKHHENLGQNSHERGVPEKRGGSSKGVPQRFRQKSTGKASCAESQRQMVWFRSRGKMGLTLEGKKTSGIIKNKERKPRKRVWAQRLKAEEKD